ncbi:M48 family metallopeptidase [Novosphingobium rosa]|uniref:M48 family metallopeptidase n=1 Tax=Novosphingobium rosa TaxID=76978 RepID=UPI00082EEFC3|nr:YgjP-like metallopeptidase domain-containing protein [Novosphingobium rosa]
MAVLPDFLRRSFGRSAEREADVPPAIEIGGRQIPVTIRRLAQSRRMVMRLAPDASEIRISMPRWGRTAEALAFAKSRALWLEAQLARHVPPALLGDGSSLPFRGMVLRIDHMVSAPRRPVVMESTLRLGGPAEGLDTRIRRWLQAEAKLLFADDLAFYCARAKVAQPTLTLPTLALTNARSRWGSCSGKGIIRLNWRLIMAPDAVRRSVVAHEVAHLLHFDHSPRFHACLARLFEGDIEEANRWLKRHGRGLYGILG